MILVKLVFFIFSNTSIPKNKVINPIIVNANSWYQPDFPTSCNLLAHTENEGTEVRIIANKAGKKVKELIFKIKVGE